MRHHQQLRSPPSRPKRRSWAKSEKSEKAESSVPMAARELADDEPDSGKWQVPRISPPRREKCPLPDHLQKRIIIGIIIVGLVIAYFVGMYFFTSAKVVLFAQAQPTNISTNFAVTTTGNSTVSAGILGGETIQATKTLTSTFQATGSQDGDQGEWYRSLGVITALTLAPSRPVPPLRPLA